ncbi:hypothetical protein IC762_18780 [Bradyrhizobium genosp. L]|uniref:right-handed parallel beta-helix repeat-containing protein n=1 Tax=Bradyrhizobium genosp. L TaxID=83637 RepID=UPI0018A2AB12|nr:right-handed parallel beta-helix repeat-containing protein [Bradyrhizobium genosp. L]QPF81850.1 hypothetical protein IC762_18780 [Bradyrhizobium genosp. L]
MKRLLEVVAIVLAATLLTIQWSSEANAQSIFTYVSSSGSDSSSCYTPATACATLPRAIAQNFGGGVVQCVDAANFNIIANHVNIVIDRSITINCVAGAAISAASIVINAPSQIVKLRNVGITGLSGYTAGPAIEIVAASQVFLENVTTSGNPSGPGIYDHRTGPGGLVVRNSSIVGSSGVGILVAPASGSLGVELDNVNSAYNNYGLAVGSGGRVMAKNSVFAYNATSGVQVDAGGFVSISSSEISFNSTGIGAGGSVALQGSTVVSNTTAIQGATQSLGNNRIFANIHDGTAPTIVSGQ